MPHQCLQCVPHSASHFLGPHGNELSLSPNQASASTAKGLSQPMPLNRPQLQLLLRGAGPGGEGATVQDRPKAANSTQRGCKGGAALLPSSFLKKERETRPPPEVPGEENRKGEPSMRTQLRAGRCSQCLLGCGRWRAGGWAAEPRPLPFLLLFASSLCSCLSALCR